MDCILFCRKRSKFKAKLKLRQNVGCMLLINRHYDFINYVFFHWNILWKWIKVCNFVKKGDHGIF